MTINKDEAAQRVLKYLDERAKMPKLHQEEIASLHIGDEREAILLTSDLRALAATSHIAPDAAAIQAEGDELENLWVALLDAANAYLSRDADPGIMIALQDKQTWLALGTKAQIALMCDGRSGLQIEQDKAKVKASPAIAPEASELPPLPDGAAWSSPLRYGSKITFPKPVKPEKWDDDEQAWYCHPYFTAEQYREGQSAAIAMHRAAAAPTAQQAIDFIEKRAADYLRDNAETEHDTGATVFNYGAAGREYHSGLVELADDLRTQLAAAEPVPTDLSRRLRTDATLYSHEKQAIDLAAADEIDRYYGGMIAWKRTAEAKDIPTKPAAEKAGGLSETQAYRTGYGEGVRRAAQMMADRDLPVMAELIRNLQSTRAPASEAVGVKSIKDDPELYGMLRDYRLLPCTGPERLNAIYDRIDAYFAAPAAPTDATAWMPIESAPKDGRTLLLGRSNEMGNWRTMRGQWFTQVQIDDEWECPDGFEEGWYETAVEPDAPNCWAITPTHWMPLPQAPKTEGGE